MSQQMNENFKFKIAIDSKIKSNGRSKIYLRIRCKGVKHDHHFGVDWPLASFDAKFTRILPRFVNDPDYDAATTRINEILKRANKVSVKSFINNQQLTIASFMEEIDRMMDSDENFFVFITKRAQVLYDKKIIVNGSYRRHKSSRNRLMEFTDHKPLPINSINLELIKSFDAWARKVKKYEHNTVCGFHKDLKNYLNVAVKEKLIHGNPYKEFGFKFEDGFREPLSQAELVHLKNYFLEMPNCDQREIIRRFLFSCVTGIRISDSLKITKENIRDGYLYLTEVKGSSLYGKKTKIPLNKFALELIANRSNPIFTPYSNKHINEQLKIIAAKCGFEKNLTFHCSRDTFATLFIELGGNVIALQKLMGHKNIRTTMIYVKLAEERKVNQLANFDALLD
jgi:integrase